MVFFCENINKKRLFFRKRISKLDTCTSAIVIYNSLIKITVVSGYYDWQLIIAPS